MQLYKIHTYYVVANSLEQAKEAVKDNLPASYFSESVCPVHAIAVEQPLALDLALPPAKDDTYKIKWLDSETVRLTPSQ